MAHDEACQLYIKQEIERGLQEGKKPWTIGKELSAWVEKLFEVNIPHRTLEQQARRKNATNVAVPVTIENYEEKEEKRLNRDDNGRFDVDNCGGPGRPLKYQYSCADQMVSIAISQLSRITKNDPKREWAKQTMLEWINTNL